jgi:hypothetical protein
MWNLTKKQKRKNPCGEKEVLNVEPIVVSLSRTQSAKKQANKPLVIVYG